MSIIKELFFFLPGNAEVQIMNTTQLLVPKDHTISLVCLASGSPKPNVMLQIITNENKWERLPIHSQSVSSNGTATLWRYQLSEYKDRIAYRCLANNTDSAYVTSEIVVLWVEGEFKLRYNSKFLFYLIAKESNIMYRYNACRINTLQCGQSVLLKPLLKII